MSIKELFSHKPESIITAMELRSIQKYGRKVTLFNLGKEWIQDFQYKLKIITENYPIKNYVLQEIDPQVKNLETVSTFLKTLEDRGYTVKTISDEDIFIIIVRF